jgi:hypothetical protein
MVTMDMVMARERLDTLMDMAMDTLMDTVMVMVDMDTMVKQQLFICSTKFSKIDLGFSESSQKKHTPDIKNQNSLFEIKDQTNRIYSFIDTVSYSNIPECLPSERPEFHTVTSLNAFRQKGRRL